MIYYSHVNEDNAVERELFLKSDYESLYCVAGSGERVIALLDHPFVNNVHVIDSNPEALYLFELKLKALIHMSVEEYLSFIGFHDSSNRWKQYLEIRHALSLECREYWNELSASIEFGVLNIGHFEMFLDRVRPLLRTFLGPGFFRCFEYSLTPNPNFPYVRWYIINAIFKLKIIYKLMGLRDGAFINKDAEIRNIPTSLNRVLNQGQVQSSSMFHLVFNGHLQGMPEENLPASMKKPVLKKIKEALSVSQYKIHFHKADVLDYFMKLDLTDSGNSFISLSDLLSFEDWAYHENLFGRIFMEFNQSTTVIFRSFLRNRITQSQFEMLHQNFHTVKDLTEFERSYMYQVILIDSES